MLVPEIRPYSRPKTYLPINLILETLKYKTINTGCLKVFTGVKLYWPDKVPYSDHLIVELAQRLRMNKRTVATHFAKLKKLNWISHDRVTNVLYVRSVYGVLPKSKRETHYRALVDEYDLTNFTEFLLAAIVKYLITRKRNAGKKSALIYDGATQDDFSRVFRLYDGYKMALRYLAKVTGKSVSWVEKYKKKAMHLKMIFVKDFYIPSGLSWKDRRLYLARKIGKPRMVKEHKGELIYRDGDILNSTVNLKWKKSAQ